MSAAHASQQATPARDPTGPRRAFNSSLGSAAISGVVVALSSAQPVAGATVSIYEPRLPDGRMETAADSEGRFEFRDLVAGRYTVGASNPGFVNVIHGQPRVGAGGRAIRVLAGEHRQITLLLPRPSAISGGVADERGNPAARVSVRAMRFSLVYGYRRAQVAGQALSDEQGHYRILSLQPGEYEICASTDSTAPLNAMQRLRLEIDRLRKSAAYVLGPSGLAAQRELAPQIAALEARLPADVDPIVGYAHVCHPGNGSLRSLIRVGTEEERSGVNLQLVPTRLARVEGVVTGVPGADFELDPIMMINADDGLGVSPESVRADLEGRFTFRDVKPGRYRLIGRGSASGGQTNPRFRAEADVTVAERDIDSVVLQFAQGATVTGQVVWQGTSPPPAALLSRIEVRLAPAVPNSLSMYTGTAIARPDQTGRFAVPNVSPGEYRISTGPYEVTEWFLDSAMVSSQDLVEQPLVVRPGEDVTGLTLTMTNRRAELVGTMVSENGEPAPEYLVLVYARDEKYWTSHTRRVSVTRPKPDGTFAVTGLRGGSYRVATLLDVESGAWLDPAFLRQLEGVSVPLNIGDGERKILNLRR